MAGRTAWFPGHMAKGSRALADMLGKLDVVIEVRDARAPHLTSSPLAERLGREKPRWIVLTKKDLAEDSATNQWISSLRNSNKEVWAFNLLSSRIEGLRRAIAASRPKYRELRLAVFGIPNVGKSALLNLLLGKKAAPVGGIPGVTRDVNWYKGQDCLVVDSPGILDPHSGARVQQALAWLGCSKSDVIGGHDRVALGLIEFLLARDLWHVVERRWNVARQDDAMMLFEALGRRLGCLVSGGRIDYELTGRRFLESFASGRIGALSLERPDCLALDLLQEPQDERS